MANCDFDTKFDLAEKSNYWNFDETSNNFVFY